MSLRASAGVAVARVKELLADRGENSIARRMAGTAFLIRVFGAGVMYSSHILLARWMGSFEFGDYVYVWTWLVLVGGLAPLGITQRSASFPNMARPRISTACAGFSPAAGF